MKSDREFLILTLLQKLEDFRNKMEKGEIQAGCPDWIVRFCEAIVADYGPFSNREEWTEKLKSF